MGKKQNVSFSLKIGIHWAGKVKWTWWSEQETLVSDEHEIKEQYQIKIVVKQTCPSVLQDFTYKLRWLKTKFNFNRCKKYQYIL